MYAVIHRELVVRLKALLQLDLVYFTCLAGLSCGLLPDDDFVTQRHTWLWSARSVLLPVMLID